MNTIDAAALGALAAQLHQVDAAQQALKDACSTLQAATDMGSEPERLDALVREVCGASSDCECAWQELVEVVRATLYGLAKESGSAVLVTSE